MQKNQIYIHKGTEYLKMTWELLEKCGLADMIGDRSKRIAIKPNLVSPATADWGSTTHPEIVEAIIQYLQSKGFENITMMEGSWVGDLTSEAIIVCGYNKLIEKYNIPFIDLQQEPGIWIEKNGEKINICKCVQDVDFMINVPVLKGHCQTNITCALKNMKGLIPNSEKRRFHSEGLHKPIAFLNTMIRQDFIVVDNICGDLDFEDGGNPVQVDQIMAAVDSVLIDAYVCRFLNYKLEEVPYVKLAGELGIGCSDISKAEIIKLSDDIMINKTFANKAVEVSDIVEEVDSCSACYGTLVPVLSRLKDEGLYNMLDDHICIGQGFKGKTGKLGIGSCTRDFQFSLKGCPPSEEEIYNFLKDYIYGNE